MLRQTRLERVREEIYGYQKQWWLIITGKKNILSKRQYPPLLLCTGEALPTTCDSEAEGIMRYLVICRAL